MSVADQIHDHQARCLAPLISLRMLAQGEAGTPLPRWVEVEVAQATAAVLAEAGAAGRAALSAIGASTGHPRDDSAEMRVHLRRFESLTSAIWTVQDAEFGSRQVSTAP
jgi:hypothetical protein